MSDIRESIISVKSALASKPDAGPAPDRPAVAVIEDGLRCRIEGASGWTVVTDMPPAVGGEGAAPTPGWLIRAALASCAATTIAMRAAELDLSLTRLEVTAESETDMRGLLGIGDGVQPGPVSALLRVRLAAEAADAQRLEELVVWADSHSPVGDCVRRAVPVELEIAAG
ncbi:MAG TPA: OsmC family protein [Gaiellaceae bacterium]|nr:OsmC family protein [Gaiellaceae bacterium]